MLLNIKKDKKSFSIIELLISLMIISIISGAIMAMTSSFTHRQELMNSALKLVNDLRLTQQFARSRKDDYNFYGLRFYENLGSDNKRHGYKIVRYPPSGYLTVAADININTFEIIKTSVESEAPPAQYIEDTFFAARVEMDAASEFVVEGGAGWPTETPNSIVFNLEGSATYDGDALLNSGGYNNDEIVLSMGGSYSVTIEIVPLTGIVRVK